MKIEDEIENDEDGKMCKHEILVFFGFNELLKYFYFFAIIILLEVMRVKMFLMRPRY